ncbi:MAG TPA: type II toxin-antitoxin system HicB family antitoxin [Gemmataceae bacterium]|nr:type II toxin-antitoxin system HicB family antitoxin [Gemmataceae bacterium]
MSKHLYRPLKSARQACFGGDMTKRLTAVIHREGDGFVALCPELDVASQGNSIEAARDNLREALELFFECASPAEIQERLGEEIFITQVDVACG